MTVLDYAKKGVYISQGCVLNRMNTVFACHTGIYEHNLWQVHLKCVSLWNCKIYLLTLSIWTLSLKLDLTTNPLMIFKM